MEQAGMMPVLLPIRPSTDHIPPDLRLAAIIVRDAAEALAEEARDASDAARYLLAADRISTVLDSPRSGRERFLLASPALTERSGRNRTLIEMIEAEPADDDYRLRLAKLLFRALLWRPETFPPPNA
jgi:hypothetical protein